MVAVLTLTYLLTLLTTILRPVSQPTPLTIPNGIWIHSAVLPQYTFWTDRHTDQRKMV